MFSRIEGKNREQCLENHEKYDMKKLKNLVVVRGGY